MGSETVKLMFDGELLDCLVTRAADGEIVCYARDRRFVKFPKGTDLKKAVKAHNEGNKAKPATAEEVDAQAAALADWFDE